MTRTRFTHLLLGAAACFSPLLATAQELENNPVDAIPTEKPSNKAKAHFLAGVAAMKEDTPEGYEIAIREFRAAYADFPSWKILGNWGIAAHRLERHGEALGLFERYLKEGGSQIEAEERQAVLADIASIQRELATLRVIPPEDWSTYWLVDRRFSTEKGTINRYGPFSGSTTLSVGFGNRTVFLEDEEGARSDVWTLLIMPGDTAEHQYEAAQPASGRREAPLPLAEDLPPVHQGSWQSTAAYISWGTGLVAGAGAVAALLHANALQREADRDFNTACPNGAQRGEPGCSPTRSGDRTAATWRTVALGGAVAAGAGLALGTWFYFTDDGLTLEASVDLHTVGLRGWF